MPSSVNYNIEVFHMFFLNKVPQNKKKIRKDPQKNSYERRAYESVDEKSLSYSYVTKNDEKKNLGTNGLTTRS